MLSVQQLLNFVTPCASAPSVLQLKRFGFAPVGGGGRRPRGSRLHLSQFLRLGAGVPTCGGDQLGWGGQARTLVQGLAQAALPERAAS